VFSHFVRKAGVLLAITAVSVLGVGGAAHAASAATDGTPASGTTIARSDGPALPKASQIDVTFDRLTTASLWRAARVSRAALRIACDTKVPFNLRPNCYALIVFYDNFIRLGTPNGRCLKIDLHPGLPSATLSYIRCPLHPIHDPLTAGAGSETDAAGANIIDSTRAWTAVAESSELPPPHIQQFDITFDRFLTQALWINANVSLAEFTVYCVTFVPAFARPVCLLIAHSSLYATFLRMGPPNGRCLKSTPRIGIPPVRLSYVSCP